MKETTAILHSGLPREGPGSDASTREALRRLPPLPEEPVVLDLGCGPGRQSLVLARVLRVKVTAIDIHQPYLDQLSRSAEAERLAQFIEPCRADIGSLDIPDGSVDLVWSEGAAYIMGFQESLRRWRRLLKPAGLVAVTELCWLTDDPPDEPPAFWQRSYPAMATTSENCRRARSAGLDVLGRFTLPESDWWDEYYNPLLRRIAELRPSANALLADHLDQSEQEIELFRRHSGAYGYVFFLLRAT
ncbi:MAG TPA: class I SAM-dependent methyltransferase [Pirellulales bacterium]|nr:class I SAM-dependent methyltransferase [Pirellulales bacterium]